MSRHLRVVTIIATIFILSSGLIAQTSTSGRAEPIKTGEVPQRKKIAPIPTRGTYVPPRTPWGDPDIAGDYNNSDESGIPFERPDEFAGRRSEDFTQAELAKLVEQRQLNILSAARAEEKK